MRAAPCSMKRAPPTAPPHWRRWTPAVRPGGILEVNTGGVFRGWRSTFYPAPFLLRRAAEKGHARHRQRRRPLRRGAVFRLCTRARDAAAGRLFQRVGAARRAPSAKRRCKAGCAAQRAKRLAKTRGRCYDEKRNGPRRPLPCRAGDACGGPEKELEAPCQTFGTI